ncbi:MAG: sugar phosphate isomerase/epimerase [Saprospiraceae bacterium]|jgi:sugar phosphate isomerase/epimerase
MQLGFVSAILPEKNLEEVFQIASDIGYDCVEVMCWPAGKAERRYAGVTHIDVSSINADSILEIQGLQKQYGIAISGLGYYGNLLTSDSDEAKRQIKHTYKLIDAASELGVQVVNTFVGRDHTKSVEDNWPRFLEIWKPLIVYAEKKRILIGIENCPMFFTADEWPGGKNMATTPEILRKMYEDIPSKTFGLNYDPSHMIIQHMSTEAPVMYFSNRLHHVHAKDCVLDKEALDQHGVFSHPNLWHIPKLPGRGSVDWHLFIATLKSVGYHGAVCVEVEDRDYEEDLALRIEALRQSHDYLRPLL